MSNTPLAGNAGQVCADGRYVSRARAGLQTNSSTSVQTDPDDNRFILRDGTTGFEYSSVGSTATAIPNSTSGMLVKEF